MKRNIFLLFVSVTFFIFISCNKEDSNPVDSNSSTSIDKIEAQIAFEYLNSVRGNPSLYSNEIGDNLSYVQSIQKLNWNNTLANVAENKAKDMADKNYFAHVDPDGYGLNYFINEAGYTLIPAFLKTKNLNNFESIAAGYNSEGWHSGKEFIKILILDDGLTPNENKGHRIHLLGIDKFWSNCYDIGIGIARNPNSQYKNYCSVVIAKHNY